MLWRLHEGDKGEWRGAPGAGTVRKVMSKELLVLRIVNFQPGCFKPRRLQLYVERLQHSFLLLCAPLRLPFSSLCVRQRLERPCLESQSQREREQDRARYRERSFGASSTLTLTAHLSQTHTPRHTIHSFAVSNLVRSRVISPCDRCTCSLRRILKAEEVDMLWA